MVIAMFYILVGLYFIHLIRLFLPLVRYKRLSNGHRPPFSIIIGARDELSNLKELLPLILNQKYSEFEVIIALDRCTDDSSKYLESIKSSNPSLHIIDIKNVPDDYSGKKYALTQAIKSAKHEWLLFTDADCRPSTLLWIESFAVAITDKSSILMGVSPYFQKSSLLNHFIQYETTYTAMKYVSTTIENNPYMAVGRNLAYRKSLFLSKNGFAPFEGITGGDDDLLVQKYANRENTGVVIEKNGITYSEAKNSLKEYMRQKTRHLHVGKLYAQKNVHIYWTAIHGLLWLCFIYLVLAQPINIGVISTFILLILIKGLIFNLSSRKMGFNYNPLFLPISDLIYGVLYPFVGIRALLLRKVKWK